MEFKFWFFFLDIIIFSVLKWHNNLFSVFLLVLFFYIARDIMGGILRFNVFGGWRACLGEMERGDICKIDLIFF